MSININRVVNWLSQNAAWLIIVLGFIFTVGKVYADGITLKGKVEQLEISRSQDHDLLLEIKNDVKWLIQNKK